jgi:L-rhamnose isomerase/sugar isomerase
MLLNKQWIEESNGNNLAAHQRSFEYIVSGINNPASILQKLIDFQVAIPSWALGTGGTRFGRFSGG